MCALTYSSISLGLLHILEVTFLINVSTTALIVQATKGIVLPLINQASPDNAV